MGPISIRAAKECLYTHSGVELKISLFGISLVTYSGHVLIGTKYNGVKYRKECQYGVQQRLLFFFLPRTLHIFFSRGPHSKQKKNGPKTTTRLTWMHSRAIQCKQASKQQYAVFGKGSSTYPARTRKIFYGQTLQMNGFLNKLQRAITLIIGCESKKFLHQSW